MSAPEEPDNVRAMPLRIEEVDVVHHDDALAWLMSRVGAGPLTGMYRRGDELVHTPRVDQVGYVEPEDGDDGPAQVRTLSPAGVVARINTSQWIAVVRKSQKGTTRPLFPEVVARTALEYLDEAINLPALRGVTHVPMPRADGTLITEPGYDEASGYIYLPTAEVPAVPTVPTPGEVAAAVALLRGLVSEFAWAGDHDEANYLGLLLTPLLRLLCPPPYKLGAIMARQPGSGKSLLAKVLRAVHDGVTRTEMPRDDAELEKVLYSILSQTTAPVVTFDNVSGTLRSSRFDGLLTEGRVSMRRLGSNDHPELVNDRLWTITGNNLNLGGDTVRRTLWVTIDPRVPNPEARTGFTITDLVAHVIEHRGEVLAALLTLVAHWRAVGSPCELRSSDDYARWSGTVRAILTTAGVPGEFDSTESRQQTAGADDEGWGAFLAVLADEMGTDQSWTVAELGGLGAENRTRLGEALPDELHERYVKGLRSFSAISRSLGKWLSNRDGRFAGDLTARAVGETRTGVKRWKVERYDAASQEAAS